MPDDVDDPTTDGPADAGAESMNPAQPGDAMPGDPPGAQSSDEASLPSEMEGKQ